MKYQKVFNILFVTCGIWALAAPACDTSKKDPTAAGGAPDELTVSPAFGIGMREVGAVINVMATVEADGEGVGNIKVRFNVIEGGGSVSQSETRTDQYGITRVNWTLGGTPGPQKLQVIANDNNNLVFEVTGTAQAKPLAAVIASPDTLRLDVGQTGNFTAQGRDAQGGSVIVTATWSALTPTIADVHTATGLVTAKAAGLGRVVASAEGKSDTVYVRVSPPQQTNTLSIDATTTMHMYRIGSGTMSGTGLAAGDAEGDGNGTVQGFLLFNLGALPAGANITSAKVRISANTGNFLDNPFALGALYLEASPGNLPALGDDPVVTASAGLVMSSALQNAEVDVTNIIKANQAAGTVWLRLRLLNPKNNNGTSEIGQFTAGPLTITY